MSMIVGLMTCNFTTKEGTKISGQKIFLTEKIPPDKGEGCSVDSLFLSDAKAEAIGCTTLRVGDEVNVYFNKYGRVCDIKISDESIDY